MENFNQDGLQGFLYCLFLQRNTAESAHGTLVRATDDNVVSIQDVEHLFQQMKIGEYGLKFRNQNEKIEQDPRLMLQNFPKILHEKIVKNLDINSRLIFRNTSRLFRMTVDGTELKIEKFKIIYNRKLIVVSIDENFRVEYERTKGGCIVRTPRSLWLDKTNTFKNRFETDMTTILRQKNLSITHLIIRTSSKEKLEGDNLIDLYVAVIIHRILNGREKKMKVETLSIQSTDNMKLKDVLTDLDPSIIKHLRIKNRHCYSDGFEEELFGLEQWKNVKSFKSDKELELRDFLKNCSHFTYANFKLSIGPTNDEVLVLKELLLKNPKLKQFRIETEMKESEFVRFNEEVGTFNMRGQENPSWVLYKYPKYNKTLELCVADKYIWFKGPCFGEPESDVEDEDSEEENDDDSDSDDE